METLLLAAMILTHRPAALPICPQRFVKDWQVNGVSAAPRIPAKGCRYKTDTGTYTCRRNEGCHR